MRTFVLALLVGCAPTAMTTNGQHPANPDAPTGRLAGPPAALRPGVADLSKPTPSTTDYSSHGASGAPNEHAGHGQPEPQAPAKAEPEPAKTDETKSEPAKKPAEKPRKQTKPPASKKAPAETSTDTPKQPPPPAHQGHEGHH